MLSVGLIDGKYFEIRHGSKTSLIEATAVKVLTLRCEHFSLIPPVTEMDKFKAKGIPGTNKTPHSE